MCIKFIFFKQKIVLKKSVCHFAHIYITGFLQNVRLSYKSYTDRAWLALHYVESAFWGGSSCSSRQPSITTNPPLSTTDRCNKNSYTDGRSTILLLCIQVMI